MQGVEVPRPSLTAAISLPPGTNISPSPIAPPSPVHQFLEIEDTSGQARMGTCVCSQATVDSLVLRQSSTAETLVTNTTSLQV